jgi:uncharacterized protein (DUF488 family)
MRSFYTIGHSSHSMAHVVGLLQANEIEVLVDTRSYPYSKWVPHFGRESLKEAVEAAGIRYLYMGDVVGGRPKQKEFYDEGGRLVYARVAASAAFLEGIARLERGAERFRVTIMCAEENPNHCHRRLLIGRVLMARGSKLLHIRGTGEVQDDASVAAELGKDSREMQAVLFE